MDITNSLDDDDDTLASQIASDISDEPAEPLRSPSRLGFSFSHSDGGCDGTVEDVEALGKLKWTFGLFQAEEDDDESSESVTIAADASFCSSSSSELEDASSSEGSDEDEDEAAGPILFHKAPAKSPLAKAPLVRPSPAPLLALSPLAPHYSNHRNPSPRPLEISHHGLSQSSLTHQKWFWRNRYDEWVAWEAEAEVDSESADAYGGIAVLSGTCGERHLYPPRSPPPSPPAPSPTLNPRIFPRMGDLSALRDPHSVSIDRCFCHFPMWTMHKTLYLFDMHHRSTDQKTENIDEGITAGASLSEEEVGDITLAAGDDDESDVTVVSSRSSSAKTKCASLPGDADEADSDFHTSDGVRAWEISWYARWELLIELVKREEFTRHASKRLVMAKPVQPAPMFFFAGENGGDAEEDGDDWDDDDDEDYGAIVANPLYGNGRSSIQVGFERAQEFFAIGNRNIDVRSGVKMLSV